MKSPHGGNDLKLNSSQHIVIPHAQGDFGSLDNDAKMHELDLNDKMDFDGAPKRQVKTQ